MLETAEYVVAQNIDHESAFNWWAPHVLKRCDQIISFVKEQETRYLKQTHKVGVEVSTSVGNAFILDEKNEIPSGPTRSPRI